MSGEQKCSDDAKLKSIIIVIKEALLDIAVYKSMHDMLDVISNGEKASFITIMNNCACMATIRLANIFGAYSEDNHWRGLIGSKDRLEIINECFGSEQEYNAIHNNLVRFRDQFAVHMIPSDKKPDYVFPRISSFKKFLLIVLKQILISNGFDRIEETVEGFDRLYVKTYDDTKQLFSS